MVELSEEIIANIISQLPDPQVGQDPRPCSLAQYATVSRSWQEGVEARTFAHLTLTPDRLASPLAAQALTPNRVHRFVRSVEVNTLLPPYDEEARKRVEDKNDKLANNRVFTDIIRKTFTLLSPDSYNTGNAQTQERQLGQGVSPPSPYRPKIKLSLTASCLSDQQDWQGRQWRRNVSAISTGDIFEARYESSYLDLSSDAGRTVQDEAEALPELICISEFEVEGTARRYFAPRALCLMASRMRGLRSLKLELYDNEKRDFALRKILRSDFAKALETLPSSLEAFHLEYSRHEPMNHSYQQPSLLDESDQDGDKLTIALRKLSERLERFHVGADVGLEIYGPTEAERQQDDEQQQPRWPRMRRHSVYPGAIAPSGEWRWQRAPDYESDDEAESLDSQRADEAARAPPGDDTQDWWREALDPDVARRLLLAGARAAASMPRLLWMDVGMNPPGRGPSLHVSYRSNNSDGAAGEAPNLCIETSPVYQPDEEVLQLWREAARVNGVGELEVETMEG